MESKEPRSSSRTRPPFFFARFLFEHPSASTSRTPSPAPRPPPTTLAPHPAFARHSPPSRLASAVRPSPKASPKGASEHLAGRPTARTFSLARKREPLLLNARQTTRESRAVW